MQGTVTTTKNNNLTTITFSHPAHNSMPGHQLAALTEAIDKAGEDPDTSVILLQSGGDRTFCAGASFDELAAISDFEAGKKFFMGFANVINACRKSPKLIIGRVQGKAVGGGVGIAAAVDYCVATKYASVKLSELALGIGPFVVGPAVERKIGLSAFSQMSIDAATWRSAHWAESKGLYTNVFESTEEMDNYIDKFAHVLATMSPGAMAALKRVIWEGTENWDKLLAERAEISGRLVLSEFTRKAIAAIKTKSA
jgi:methylglutaconyl-CoA hydratase